VREGVEGLTKVLRVIRINSYHRGVQYMKKEKPKTDILLRLRRIEGQIRGLQRMVEKEIPCPEILTQVAAATAAIKKVGTVIVQSYMEECLEKTQKGFSVKQGENLRDFQKTISRYIDWI